MSDPVNCSQGKLTRRQVLTAALGTASMAALARSGLAAADPKTQPPAGLFVNHCHVSLKGFGGQRDRPEMGTIPALQEILRQNGVAGTICFAPFGFEGGRWEKIGGGKDRNQWLCEELRNHPNLRGFATVYPQDHDAASQLKQAIAGGLVGAKVHPPVMRFRLDDPAGEPFWRAAEELNIPVSIHTGSHGWNLRYYMPLLLDDIAQAHPKLPLIIEHLGGIAFFDQALAVLHNNKNCYAGLTQCSGRDPKYALDPARRDLLLSTVGADRIIYGLDYPWHENNPEALANDLAWVRSWGISEEDQQKILGGNLCRLIKK
jgi:predicted TIM-barrel fold metal-dependent hydrolase